MLMKAFVRLDTAWSARPQLRRPADCRSRCRRSADLPWGASAGSTGVGATAAPGHAWSAPAVSAATMSAARPLGDLRVRREEAAARLAAQHIVEDAGRKQLLEPPHAQETGRGE